jgi:cell division protein FtsQ
MTESPLPGAEVSAGDSDLEDGHAGTSAPGATGDESPADVAPRDRAPDEPSPRDGAGEKRGSGDRAPGERAPGDRAAMGTSEPSAVHPRVWQRRVAVLREHAHRRLRWIVAGVAVLVAVCVALLVLHTPLLALRHASVRGAQHTGSEAVLQAAGLLDAPPLIDVDPKTVAAHVEALPWVAHAVVVRHWPDSVTIIVTERVPLGSVARPGGGVALVDASGRVLAWQDSAPPGLVLVAPVTPGRPGTVLARAARPVLEVAAALPSSLVDRVVQVRADARGMVTLGLSGRLSAVLGSTGALAAKLSSLASVLAGAHVSAPAVINVTIPDEPTVGPPPPGSRP